MSYGVFLTESRSLILDLTHWTIVVTMHSVRMPVGVGRGIKTRDRPICYGKPEKNYRGVEDTKTVLLTL